MKKLLFILTFIFISCKQSTNNSFDNISIDTISSVLDTTYKDVVTPKIDSLKIKELDKYFSYKIDEFDVDKTTWVIPNSAPKFANRKALYCYFRQNKSISFNFKLKFQYVSDDWLFIENCEFLIDGKPFKLIPNNVQRDNGGGEIWEWFDEPINNTNNDLIEALAEAKSAKIKLNGSQYYKVILVSSKQILDIKRSLELYKASGGTFSTY